MRGRVTLYIMQDTWRHIRHAGKGVWVGVLMLGLVLCISGLWAGVYVRFADQWQDLSKLGVTIYLKPGSTKDAADRLLARTLKNGPKVEWTFVSQAKDRQENNRLLHRIAPNLEDMDIGAPRVDTIARVSSPSDIFTIQEWLGRLKGDPMVDFVVAPQIQNKGLAWVAGGIQAIGWLAVVMMFIASLFATMITIGRVIDSRSTEIKVIDYFGGTAWFYRLPLMLETLFFGVVAGLIGVFLAWIGWELLLGALWSSFSVDLGINGPPLRLFFTVAAGGPVGGLTAFFFAGKVNQW